MKTIDEILAMLELARVVATVVLFVTQLLSLILFGKGLRSHYSSHSFGGGNSRRGGFGGGSSRGGGSGRHF